MLLDLPMKLWKMPPNPYDVHSIVYDAMLGERKDEGRDFLFTILPDLGGMVIIRSQTLPFHMRSCALPVVVPEERERRAFELVAAPMTKGHGVAKALPKDQPGLRLEWLSRMGQRHGFEVAEASVSSRPLNFDRKGVQFWLERAEFRGEIIVSDQEKLTAALASGIGRGRGLGFGMMRLM